MMRTYSPSKDGSGGIAPLISQQSWFPGRISMSPAKTGEEQAANVSTTSNAAIRACSEKAGFEYLEGMVRDSPISRSLMLGALPIEIVSGDALPNYRSAGR
jgi:hypothetical protein